MYMYINMYIYICIYIHIYIYLYTHTHFYVNVYICMYIYIHLCTYTPVHIILAFNLPSEITAGLTLRFFIFVTAARLAARFYWVATLAEPDVLAASLGSDVSSSTSRNIFILYINYYM